MTITNAIQSSSGAFSVLGNDTSSSVKTSGSTGKSDNSFSKYLDNNSKDEVSQNSKEEVNNSTGKDINANKVSDNDSNSTVNDKVSETGNKTDTVEKNVDDGNVNASDNADIKDVVDKVNDEIKKTVCNALGIDEQTLETLMSAMGIVPTDLNNPAILQKLVLSVSGDMDTSQLLTNENLMNQISQISDQLDDIDYESLTGMSKDELMNAIETNKILTEAGKVIGSDDTAQLTGNAAQISEKASEKTSDNVANIETATSEDDTTILKNVSIVVEKAEEDNNSTGNVSLNTTNSDKNIVQKEDNKTNVATDSTTANVNAKQTTSDEGNSSTTDSNENNNSSSQNTDSTLANTVSKSENADIAVEDINGSELQSKAKSNNSNASTVPLLNTSEFANELLSAVKETAQTPQSNMQQMIDIVNQVTGQIKLSVSQDNSSMQLQLNPEHLGKVMLNVTSKNGVMTANFTVQTQEAKDALESQLFQLRQNLEQKEIKVDNVEVNVSNFDFSQNAGTGADSQSDFNRGNGKANSFKYDEDEDYDNVSEGDTVTETTHNMGVGNQVDYIA